ncbi:MAG: ATP synthase F1 subunit epsilon [Alphaproteobacteria bacterium]|nr:ATP synthase F1 subunit epsilon [Alphaproteobacteria bacterium]
MSDTTAFELVTPARVMISRAAGMVVAPGVEGLFGVLPRHAPLISTLQRGVVEVHDNGQVTDRIMVDGGIADVAEDRCTILAERAEKLDPSRKDEIHAQLDAAEQDGKDNDVDFLKAVLAALAA